EPAPWLAPRLGGTFDRAAFLRRVACARELV
ncbi:MAG: hypothetical protein QOD62_1145, partial [Actinomycetota bacterium]|nr:hypothetical protein [Actinomycetota bacterium]